MESDNISTLLDSIKKVKWNEEYINNLPKERLITASYDDKYIILYQAYNNKITSYAA
jgi:hypothetical protein